MKLLITSDLHGDAHAARALDAQAEALSPDRIVLLGDLLYHGPRNDLPAGYAPKEVIAVLNSWSARVVAVRGNCDAEVDQMVLEFPCRADSAGLSIDGHLLLLSHGHLPGLSLEKPPMLAPGGAFLSGHTHVKRLERTGEVLFVNPGSPSLPKDGLASFSSYDEGVFSLRSMDGGVISELGWG